MKGNHPLGAAQKDFAVAGDAQGIFVDGREREAVASVVVFSLVRVAVEDGEPLVGDEQQVAADGRFLGFVDAVAHQTVVRLVKILEAVALRVVEVESAARCRKPKTALLVTQNAVNIVVAQRIGYVVLVTVAFESVCLEAISEYSFSGGGYP